MALYLISYYLLNKKAFGEYEDLIHELKRLGAQGTQCHIISCRFPQNELNASTLNDLPVFYPKGPSAHPRSF
jgi:hypothetical protein